MVRSLVALCAALCPAITAVAQQQLVLPPGALASEATGSTNVPFGRSTPVLVQAAYDARLFPRPVTIQALAHRLDGATSAAGKQVELEVRLATMPVSIISLQADFATNRGADLKAVIARKIVSLPSLAQAATPNPFLVSLAFDLPFTFTPAGNSLLVETAVFGQAPGNYTLDSTWVCTSPVVNYGPNGCGPSGGPTLRATCETQQVMWGRQFFLAVRDAKPQAATLLMLGTLESGSWSGLVLPVSLAAIGAPGCWLSIDPLVTLNAAADATGLASYGFFVPSYPWLQGQVVRFQGVALDPAANALGVTSSQPGKVVVCGWESVARTWSTSVTAVTGTREIGVAPVLQLAVQ
jgi:hypothetical protein